MTVVRTCPCCKTRGSVRSSSFGQEGRHLIVFEFVCLACGGTWCEWVRPA